MDMMNNDEERENVSNEVFLNRLIKKPPKLKIFKRDSLKDPKYIRHVQLQDEV